MICHTTLGDARCRFLDPRAATVICHGTLGDARCGSRHLRVTPDVVPGTQGDARRVIPGTLGDARWSTWHSACHQVRPVFLDSARSPRPAEYARRERGEDIARALRGHPSKTLRVVFTAWAQPTHAPPEVSFEIWAVVFSAWAHPTLAPPDLCLVRPPVGFTAWVHLTHVPPKLVGNGFETRCRRDVDVYCVRCQTPSSGQSGFRGMGIA